MSEMCKDYLKLVIAQNCRTVLSKPKLCESMALVLEASLSYVPVGEYQGTEAFDVFALLK